jgi:hypothetical protein
MPIFDEDDKVLNDIEGYSAYTVDKGRKTKAVSPPSPSKFPSFLKKIPILPIILIILVVLVGIRLFSLETMISGLSAEISQLKGIRGQMASLQTSLDARIEAVNKDRNKLKSEVLQLRGEIDAMKAHQKHQAEVASQRQAAAEAKKKEKEKEKAAPKKPGSRDRRP